jgi:hypothetical protein
MTEPRFYRADIERAVDAIDLETGSFPMILATQGEAADGSILSIRGAAEVERIPLQLNHQNSPAQTLGSISQIRPGTKQGLPILRAIGRIELEGEGAQAEIRRDIALMIAKGHLSAVSIRAHGEKVTPRRDLPKDHPAGIRDDEPNLAKRFGLFFERFTPLEGSIVALGADREAIIGRSRETEGDVRDFWSEVARQLPEDPETKDPETPPQETEEATALPDVSQVQDIRTLERFLRDVGASRSEAKRIIALCKSAEPRPPRDVERHEPSEPTEEAFVRDVRALLRHEFAGLKDEIFRECRDLLSHALGRV